MNINLYTIAFIIIVGWIFSNKDSQQSRGYYIILCSIVLLVVAALRSPEWFTDRYGLDALAYKYDFESYTNKGWEEIWAILTQDSHRDEFDLGFNVLKIIISWFTDSFFVYSIIADLIFFAPFGIILYRYSTNMRQLIFAFVFYVAFIQVFLLAGARQMYAIGFDLMALLAVINRKKWLTIIFFLIGVSIHLSSFLFLIPLLMIWFKVQSRNLKLIHAACFILFPIVLYTPNQAIMLLGAASGSERYANYGTGEITGGVSTFIILIEGLSLLCLVAIKKVDLLKHQSMSYFYVMAPLFTLLAPLIRANGTMIRLSLYFHLFLILLVPFAIDSQFEGRTKIAVNYALIFILAYMILKGEGLDYYFFWQK